MPPFLLLRKRVEDFQELGGKFGKMNCGESSRDRFSQWPGLGEYPILSALEHILRGDVYLQFDQIFNAIPEVKQVKEIALLVVVHEQINIAMGIGETF